MGLFEVVEARPTPKAVYNWRLVLCAVIGSFASCAIGYDSAFIGTSLALPSFEKDFKFDSYSDTGLANLKADIVSVYQAGAFFGSLTAYVASYFLGRKTSVFLYVVPFIIGAALNVGAMHNSSLGLIIGGRVLTGWGVGGCSNVVPIYLSELSPPGIRGKLVGSWECGWQIGGVVGFWINYGVNRTMAPTPSQWVVPFAVQLIPVGLLFLGSFFIPESPRWLLSKNRRAQGIKSLTWLRKLPETDVYIIEEIKDIDTDLERNPNSFVRPFLALKHRHVQWRFTIGGLLFMFQNASGINAINYYSPSIFNSMGISGANSTLLATGVFGLVKMIEVFVWITLVVDRFKRRTLLIWGAGFGSICMWVIGAYIKAANPAGANSHATSAGKTAVVFMFFLWTVPYSQTWSGLPWVINSEMFPMDIRGLGQASASANNWFWNFIISRFTPNMILTMGYGIYFFFAALMILSMVFVYFCVPETSKVPLEYADRLFETKPVWKANEKVLEEVARDHSDFARNMGVEGKENFVIEQEEHTV